MRTRATPRSTTKPFAPLAEIPQHISMSLYYVQKLLYQFNRNPDVRRRYDNDFNGLIEAYDLTEEETTAIRKPNLGFLYVLGVNGQILVHYAALRGIAWPEYIEALRDGLQTHGRVRDGVYAEIGYEGVESHTAAILARRELHRKGS